MLQLLARLARITAIAAVLLCAAPGAQPGIAGVYVRPGNTFGDRQYHLIQENESLIELARHYDLGFNEITAANPGIDPFIPPPETAVIVPSTHILPDIPIQPGIVINLPEMRLYYFPFYSDIGVISFPIGIGDIGRGTPLGTFFIIDRIKHPSWYVPRSIRRERPDLPRVMPPGPDNPMGSHALRLSKRSILIHGTNRPFSIGRKASHGCIRLYPEDIVRLFRMVRTGTRVTIINQPVKITEWDEQIYLEAHDNPSGSSLEIARTMLHKKQLYEKTDTTLLTKALKEKSGMPVVISRKSNFKA